MRLDKLEINGFKSFADKVEFDFEPGVTAFVGPNGCGKSNIVDAVRWILGEQSAKAVRGATMQDIIFNGAEGRKPKGFAEASLTILNDRNVLPVDYREVRVTRRLYRTGESEYLLNRQPCRLRDIRELFMDTGVGMQTYSIIEQGRVARLLQANPSERRVVFEEAAGISKYKAQRKAALAKLQRTQENLERAQMLVGEKESRLRSIKYQAAKARRWREYMDRLKEIQVAIGLRDYEAAEAGVRAANEEIARIEALEAELAAHLKQSEEALADSERRSEALENAFAEGQAALHRIESERQAAEEAVGRHGELLREYEASASEARSAVESLQTRLSRTREELGAARAEYGDLSEVVQQQTDAVEEQGRCAAETAAECERLQDAVERWKGEVVEIAHRAVELRNEVTNLLNDQRREAARRGRLDERRAELYAALAQLAESERSLRDKHQALEARLAELRERMEQVERERLESIGLVASADAELRSLREREAALRERRDVLADLDAGAEDVAEGVKWLARAENRPAGFLGLVADLVRVDLQHAVAVETALGERAQAVVVEDTAAALDALAKLREGRAGRAALLPLDRARRRGGEAADLAGRPGVAGRAADLVRRDARCDELAEALLGDAWVVDTFENAAALALDGGAGARLVTLQGELFEPGGALVGGEAARRTGLISRRSELEQLAGELDALGAKIAALEAERGRVCQRAEELAAEAAALREDAERTRRERHVVDTDLQDHARQRERMESERNVILAEIEEIRDSLVDFTAREQKIQRDLEESNQRREAFESDVRQAQERLEARRAEAARLREEVHLLRVELARREQMREGLERNVASLSRAEKELDEELDSARRTIESYAAKSAESESRIAENTERMAELDAQHEEQAAELERLSAERQAAREGRNAEFERSQALRARHGEIASRLSEHRVAAERHALKMQNVEEKLRADWGMSIEDAQRFREERESAQGEVAPPAEETTEGEEDAAPRAEQPGGEPDWAALAAEAADLQDKIQRMGGVNTDALAEQEELEADIQWQVEQRDDLEKAEKQLRQIIRKINRTCRERFEEAFAQVRENFQDLFRKLFGGGSADLKLIQEEGTDILEAGIDIVARPPGKEPKSLIQLSGGEQTMTTVALVFAIFKWKPSPFCILDEVDAALDEANIDRFCAMVREFLDHSQFIIVTHSKRTMGLADMLYGVTMMEKGVSSKLAVKIDEAEKLVA